MALKLMRTVSHTDSAGEMYGHTSLTRSRRSFVLDEGRPARSTPPTFRSAVTPPGPAGLARYGSVLVSPTATPLFRAAARESRATIEPLPSPQNSSDWLSPNNGVST